MESTTVVTRTRRGETAAKDFAFVESQIPETSSVELNQYRRKAWEIYREFKLPTTAEDAWRRTDLRQLKPDQFNLPADQAYQTLAPIPENLLASVTDQDHGGQIVLLPGGVQSQLNPDLVQAGVVFTDLRTAEKEYSGLIQSRIGQIVRPEEGKFAALSSALAQTGIFLYVPAGVKVDLPLHSVLWGPGKNLAYLSHIVVWVEDGACVTYIHEAASTQEDGESLHAGILEIHVGKGAALKFVELQSWGENVWNFTHERVQVEKDGLIEWTFGSIGSHLTKNFSDLELVGEGATGKMSGFYFTDHDQHLDHDTSQNHLAPNTTSDLLFKGALLGQSRSVWQGMIYVAPGAVKTDGYQANRNLVLSPKARADSIPGLEILADDVRCTHGATVGKVDQEQIFYLESRGIPKPEAERVIVEGFFDPIMERIPFEGVKRRFKQAIHEKMSH